MRIRLLLFAALREAVGRKEHLLELPAGASLGDALALAERELPEVARYRGRLAHSLNQELAPAGTRLREGDEIALLPPMSGGSLEGRPWVQAAPLSLDALLEEIRSAGAGGMVAFIGTVRDRSRGKRIEHLEYEAYVPMAEKQMRAIAEQVLARWPEVRVAMSHRVGRLEIGDAAVMIAAAAPHRAEAFDACRFAIDALKRTVPIWKKEFSEDGTAWIEENP
jgi:molybdopterin synthase catalytic subunit